MRIIYYVHRPAFSVLEAMRVMWDVLPFYRLSYAEDEH